MSTTIIAALISVLSVLLPLIGIELSNEAVMTTIQTLAVLGSGIWVYIERLKPRGADVNALGLKKKA